MRRRDGLTRKERRQFQDLVRTFYEADDESTPEASDDADRSGDQADSQGS